MRLAGTNTSPITLGGIEFKSMIVALSGTGLLDTDVTPSTSTDLPSLDDTAICARAPGVRNDSVPQASSNAPTQRRSISHSPLPGESRVRHGGSRAKPPP